MLLLPIFPQLYTTFPFTHSDWIPYAVICLMSFHISELLCYFPKNCWENACILVTSFCLTSTAQHDLFGCFLPNNLISALTQALHPQWNQSPNSLTTNRKEWENWLTNHQVQYWDLSGYYKYTGRQQQASSMPDSRDNCRPWSMMFVCLLLEGVSSTFLKQGFFPPTGKCQLSKGDCIILQAVWNGSVKNMRDNHSVLLQNSHILRALYPLYVEFLL